MYVDSLDRLRTADRVHALPDTRHNDTIKYGPNRTYNPEGRTAVCRKTDVIDGSATTVQDHTGDDINGIKESQCVKYEHTTSENNKSPQMRARHL